MEDGAGMRKLKLSDGGFAIVDDNDYDNLKKWKWRKNNHGYVRRSAANGEYLHRYILQAPDNKLVDHINRNPLDNRRENLRPVTASENNINQRLKVNNKSGFRGVCWHKAANKWAVEIKFNNSKTHVGIYKTIEEAIGARLTAELEHFGRLVSE